MLKDFRAFIMRGNVVDMAVGIIIGVAFGAIVNSLVKEVLMRQGVMTPKSVILSLTRGKL